MALVLEGGGMGVATGEGGASSERDGDEGEKSERCGYETRKEVDLYVSRMMKAIQNNLFTRTDTSADS